MHFTAQTTGHGVVERSFAAAGIPGVLWSPDTGSSTAPLILLGHGGGLHKTSPDVVRRARHYVTTCGFRAAAIDAPGHGDRPREERDRRWVAAMLEARDAGEPIGPVVAEFNSSLAERAVPEWRAVIDALQDL
ncbi:MAG TPA: alpha/beta hydrolase, partial [Microlunatus sp.]